MKPSLCIETIFTEVPFYERFQLAKDAGFRYVEFWGWEGKDLARIKDLCVEHSLGIASFSGDAACSLVDRSHHDGYVAFLSASIEAAKKLGCPNLVIHSNALGEGGVVLRDYKELTESEKTGSMIRTLLDCAPLAEKAGITLVLEALNTKKDHVGNFLASTRDSASAVACVSSPRIKLLYDVYHMQIMEGNIVDTIKAHCGAMGYVHIADVPGRAEPGTGEIDYERVFRAFRECGYGGFIGFELFPSRESGPVAQELLKLFA